MEVIYTIEMRPTVKFIYNYFLEIFPIQKVLKPVLSDFFLILFYNLSLGKFKMLKRTGNS